MKWNIVATDSRRRNNVALADVLLSTAAAVEMAVKHILRGFRSVGQLVS